MMPVSSSRLGAIRATYKGATAPAGAASVRSDLVQIAPLDKGDQFIPFGMREPDGICILADPDALISDFDLGALRAKRAKGELKRFHLDVLLDVQVGNPTIRSRYGCKGSFMPEIDIAVHARPEALDLHLSMAATAD